MPDAEEAAAGQVADDGDGPLLAAATGLQAAEELATAATLEAPAPASAAFRPFRASKGQRAAPYEGVIEVAASQAPLEATAAPLALTEEAAAASAAAAAAAGAAAPPARV